MKDAILETQKMIIEEKNRAIRDKNDEIKRLHDSNITFQMMFGKQFSKPANVNISPEIHMAVSPSFKLHSSINIEKALKADLFDFIKEFEIRLQKLQNKREEQTIKQSLERLKDELNKEYASQSIVIGCLKTIQNVLEGAMGSILASDLLPKVVNLIANIS